MSFKSELDVYRFIMDIETYVLESTQVPFTNKVLIDKDTMYDYLDKLRSRLPKEIKECKRIIEKSQREENNAESKINAEKDLNSITNSEGYRSQTQSIQKFEDIQETLQAQQLQQLQDQLQQAQQAQQAQKFQQTQQNQEYTKRLEEIHKLETQKLEEAQEKCQIILSEAEQKAQKIILQAYKYTDDYVEKIMKTLEDQIKEQINEVHDGRGQIADVIKKLKSY